MAANEECTTGSAAPMPMVAKIRPGPGRRAIVAMARPQTRWATSVACRAAHHTAATSTGPKPCWRIQATMKVM